MHRIQAGSRRPLEQQPGRRQGRKMLRSPARRTGFPAVGQENTPSHCPSRVTGSPCAPPETMSVPTLATKENKKGFLAFCAKLPPASLTRKARHRERWPSSWPLTNVPRQPLVGCWGGKYVAAQGKTLSLDKQTLRGEARKSGHQPALQSAVPAPAPGRQRGAGCSAVGHGGAARGAWAVPAGQGRAQLWWWWGGVWQGWVCQRCRASAGGHLITLQHALGLGSAATPPLAPG